VTIIRPSGLNTAAFTFTAGPFDATFSAPSKASSCTDSRMLRASTVEESARQAASASSMARCGSVERTSDACAAN
jgi:hypothetical protein